MVLHLAERLDVPLGERNALLLAAGFAPEYRERGLDDAEMAAVRDALGRFLDAHEPYPALVADRRCDIVMTNGALGVLLDGVSPGLLQPPANAMRIALHPDGMAPRILNLPEWSGHLLHVLRRRAEAEGDPELEALHDELAGLPGIHPGPAGRRGGGGRRRAAAPPGAGRRRAHVPVDDVPLRHGARRDPRGPLDRGVLPGGRRDRRGPPGRGPASRNRGGRRSPR